MQALTDEDRQNIVAKIREVALMWGGGSVERYITKLAADEIERLAAEVEAMADSDNQKLLEAEMRNHDLNEEIKYQHKEIERLTSKLESWRAAYAAVSRELINSFEDDGKVRLENAAG